MDHWRATLDKLSELYSPQRGLMFYVLSQSEDNFGLPLEHWLSRGQILRADVIAFISRSGKFAYVIKNRWGLTGKLPLAAPWVAFSEIDPTDAKYCAIGPSRFKRAYLDWCEAARPVFVSWEEGHPAPIVTKVAVAAFEEI